jgi:hypothetical protein
MKNTYRKVKYIPSQMKSIETTEGESIERKVERIVHNNEPIQDGSPEIYTALKDGVVPAYNMRTDRWEIACEAMDVVSASMDAQREDKAKIGLSDKETAEAAGEKKEVAQGKSTEGAPGADSSKNE